MLGLASTIALAGQSAADTIRWTAPTSCPNDAEIERRIAAYVDVSGVTTVAEATVRAEPAGFLVDLVRTIDGELLTSDSFGDGPVYELVCRASVIESRTAFMVGLLIKRPSILVRPPTFSEIDIRLSFKITRIFGSGSMPPA